MRPSDETSDEPLRVRDWILVAAATIGAWLILWFQLRDFGWIQYPVSILGGLLVGLVSLSVLMPEEAAEEERAAQPGALRHPARATIPASCLTCRAVNLLPPAVPERSGMRCGRCGSRIITVEAREPPQPRAVPPTPSPSTPAADPFARYVGVCCLNCRTASSFPPQSITATLRCLKCGTPLWPAA